jgi:proteasome accessory factor B
MPPRTAEARLLKLAAWLHARREPATREEIYAAFPDDYSGKAQAREKKWTRDKQDLRRLGLVVGFLEEEGLNGGYLLEPSACALPRLELEPAEAAVLWTAGLAALRTPDHPLRDDLEVALRKIAVGGKGLPPRAASLDGERAERTRVARRALLERLTEAVERRKRVKLAYRRLDGTRTQREVDVYGYAWRRGQWIFVGHCHLRNGVRLFYLDRVLSLALSGSDPRRADYAVPASFDIHAWSRQEPWDYLVHEPREAVVRFRGSLARVAGQLLPRARIATEAGGSRVARLDVRNLEGLVRQALAWGPEAELLAPADGRALAREMLARAAARLAAEERP